MLKKLVCWVLALVMMVGCGAWAVEIDLSGLSDEELDQVIVAASAEMLSRIRGGAVEVEPSAEAETAAVDGDAIRIEKGAVLLDQGGVKVTVDSEPVMDDGTISFGVMCVNGSGKNIVVSGDDYYVDGWSCSAWFYCDVADQRKAKDGVSIYTEGSGVEASDIGGVGEIEMVMYAYDADTYEDVGEKVRLKLVP